MDYYLKRHLSPVVILPPQVMRLINPRQVILDVGCGNGALKKILPGNQLFGVDILPASATMALKAGYFRAQVVDLETNKLPFKKNSFDAIICSHVLEHLLRPLPACQEIFRVVKPSGFVFISVPTRKNSKYDDDYTHIRPFTRHALETLLYDAGFTRLSFIYQFIGLPGLGLVEKLFPAVVPRLTQTLAQSCSWFRQPYNLDILAQKS